MKVILFTLILTNVVMIVMAASILDYLSEDPMARDTETKRNCLCNGPSCICCVDFNISFIDLGGPGCVRMNYISPEEGIAINVSYGDSLLHSQTVRGPDPAPTCLNIFSSIAQMCARFRELLPTDDGLRGCVNLEPMLLGTAQLEFPIGCFKMGPNGMDVIESASEVIKEQTPTDAVAPPTADADDEDDDDENEKPAAPGAAGSIAGYSTSDILSAVSDSAEEGIALLTNWLGLGLGGGSNSTTTAEASNHNEENPTSSDEESTDGPNSSEDSARNSVW